MTGLRLAYYGDDFTGSVDVMDVMAQAGLRAGLFLDVPTAEDLARAGDLEVAGVAGASRTYSPEQMEAELPRVFEGLRKLGAPLVHYKVCSTFDSVPEVGSIGRALEIGARVFGAGRVPLLVASPPLGRYCVFGNLFARSGWQGSIYRLDRHPSMRYHPVTPMDEADLRLHLKRQTDLPIGLLDVLRLNAVAGAPELKTMDDLWPPEPGALLIDCLDDSHLQTAGALLWQQAQSHPPLFAVGSSGIESALALHWRARGELTAADALPRARTVERVLVLSGSCSPVTDRQITDAVAAGFVEIALPAEPVLRPESREQALHTAAAQAANALQAGRSAIVHTARGPQDARIEAARRACQAPGAAAGAAQVAAGKLLGSLLGEIALRVHACAPFPRLVIAGGDTSGNAVRQMGLRVLRCDAALAVSTPVCHGEGSDSLDGLELVFKGGQVGLDNFFTEQVRREV
jgi:3-oxoisoapionate kinase